MNTPLLINIVYLISSVLFIYGIKKLGSPKTARQGNFLSALGMLLAVAFTLLDKHIFSFEYILAGLLIGSAIGVIFATKVEMTAMPQMVGLLNGFGGAASALVGLAEYLKFDAIPGDISAKIAITIGLSIFIGAVTFTGSLVAYGKLQGIVSGNSVQYPMQHPINGLLIVGVLVSMIFMVLYPHDNTYVWLILNISLILGILLVIPIGGADMPVAISLLNSYSGLAGAATGFVLDNNMLIIAGALVGASGIILTNIMCKAMNRSLMSVVLGGFGATSSGPSNVAKKDVTVKSVDSEEAAMIFDSASSVIIVPGYGMAVAQAQHAVKDLMDILTKKGITVRFAIHPVAGRMPGHMNILLAESNIPYEYMLALEDINEDFRNTDVSLVIGANDVVNPAARHDTSSPVYGMPILNVDYGKTTIIIKRSMAAGYAGIDNELFYLPNSLMYFGDAKEAVTKLNNALKAL
ncbi:MAG: NAD(P)(+) transhydrogenase (Re/Si-specific) subunit beta [Ignavibacteriales bacterium]|nr:MAG: NAD(P)(+) transhydrogenase (Re/Si-specific) subunit beta [Ignavibacteriales bacterium]